MLEYERLFGLLDFMCCATSAMHRSDNSGWEFAECISKVLRDDLVDQIKSADFYSVSVDEMSSDDNHEYMSVVIYLLNNFKRNAFHLKLQHIQQVDAEGISSAILQVLSAANVCLDRVVGMASDGASVFTGAYNGVMQRLTSTVMPFMIAVHCVSHRVQLIAKGIKGIDAYDELESIVKAVFNYFSPSVKRTDRLRDLCMFLEQKYKALANECQTRFLSMAGALEKFNHNYYAILSKALEDGLDAKYIATSLLTAKTILASTAFMPLFDVLNVLVKVTQAQELYLHEVSVLVKEVTERLPNMYRTMMGSEFADWLELLDIPIQDQADPRDEVKDAGRLVWCSGVLNAKLVSGEGDEVKVVYHEVLVQDPNSRRQHLIPCTPTLWKQAIKDVHASCKSVVAHVVEDFKERFPACPLLDALSIIHKNFWENQVCDRTEEEEEEFKKLMNAHLDVLIKWVGERKGGKAPLVDAAKLRQSLDYFCDFMAVHHLSFDLTSDMWAHINGSITLANKLSEFIVLAKLALLIPIGSIENEREFSKVSFIKNDRRNRLQPTHLEACMLIAGTNHSLESFAKKKPDPNDKNKAPESLLDKAYAEWFEQKEVRGRYGQGEVIAVGK